MISSLKNSQIPAKKFPTTGQDATLQGLQNILSDYQCMTVYKPIYVEAQAAVATAMYLRAGQKPPKSLVNGSTNNKVTKVPSVLLTPQAANKDNIKTVTYGGQPLIGADGYWTPQQVCTSQFQSACQAAGIS